MSVVLSEHLPLLASAPDGIQKLRGLILELAVRGKLVPQDPNDEPASELLKRIEQERARLEAEGICKKSKPMPPVSEDEQPFDLPTGWSWGRIADVANSQAGFAFKSSAFNDAGIGLPLVRIRDVGFSNPTTFFDGSYRDEFVVTKGDYLVSMDGQFRVAVWKGPNALLNQRVSRLQFFGPEIAQSFFAISLHIRLAELQGVKAYTTVDHLSGGQISAAVVGIPPLAEQHRIVAKVDELMALCDRLEAEQTDAASAHARLVETLLGTLTQSTDAADLAANWQRLAEHFDTLFTTESSIDALKQTVLQLAVMGKLVPQDRNDESASQLLDRVRIERAQSPSVNKGKHNNSLTVLSNEQRLFALPPGWEWTQLGQLAISGPSNGYSPKPCPYETPYRCLTLSATTQGYFKPDCFKFVDITEATAHQFSLMKGDLLIQRGNSLEYVGMAALYDQENGQFIYPDLMMRIQLTKHVSARFLHNWLISTFGRSYFMRSATGTQGTMPKVNQGTVARTPIPVPPLAEQHRIIAKVDELMAFCDRLKADLATVLQNQTKLADTLIDAALESA